jgi:hypothetical protein
MDCLIISLQTVSALSTAFVGYTQGAAIQQYIDRSVFTKYKNTINIQSGRIFNESAVCKLIGASAGLLIGYYVWPITLPISLACIESTLMGPSRSP